MSRPTPVSERARADARPGGDAAEASDAELFAAIAKGQLGPLGTLFDRHHLAVRKFLFRAQANDEVDDLVQETFLTASRAASGYDGSPSARPFLIGIAAQLVRRQRRTFARLRRLLDAFGKAEPAPRKSPEDAAVEASRRSQLQRAVLALPEDLRVVLVMTETSGLSGVEVATALGVPQGTVWRRLHEARARLKGMLSEEEQ